MVLAEAVPSMLSMVLNLVRQTLSHTNANRSLQAAKLCWKEHEEPARIDSLHFMFDDRPTDEIGS